MNLILFYKAFVWGIIQITVKSLIVINRYRYYFSRRVKKMFFITIQISYYRANVCTLYDQTMNISSFYQNYTGFITGITKAIFHSYWEIYEDFVFNFLEYLHTLFPLYWYYSRSQKQMRGKIHNIFNTRLVDLLIIRMKIF